MPKMLFLIILLLTWAGAIKISAHSQKDDGFSQFYADFQNAVKADDKEKVLSMTSFDGFTWEESDSLRQVKTKEAFIKNYNRMFTKTIKSKIATMKPEKNNDDGSYFIIWHTRDLEYSLYFFHQKDGSYSFEGLTIGPY